MSVIAPLLSGFLVADLIPLVLKYYGAQGRLRQTIQLNQPYGCLMLLGEELVCTVSERQSPRDPSLVALHTKTGAKREIHLPANLANCSCQIRALASHADQVYVLFNNWVIHAFRDWCWLRRAPAPLAFSVDNNQFHASETELYLVPSNHGDLEVLDAKSLVRLRTVSIPSVVRWRFQLLGGQLYGIHAQRLMVIDPTGEGRVVRECSLVLPPPKTEFDIPDEPVKFQLDSPGFRQFLQHRRSLDDAMSVVSPSGLDVWLFNREANVLHTFNGQTGEWLHDIPLPPPPPKKAITPGDWLDLLEPKELKTMRQQCESDRSECRRCLNDVDMLLTDGEQLIIGVEKNKVYLME